MKKITKKTAFGAIAATAGLVVVGIAAPAVADNSGDGIGSTWYSQQSSYRAHNESPVVVAPEVGDVDVLGGGILSGGALNGDIANGNEIAAPIASGNETAIGNGNETAIGSGSDVSVSDVGTVTDGIDAGVSDVLNDVVDGAVSDVVDVDEILGDVSGWVDLDAMFED